MEWTALLERSVSANKPPLKKTHKQKKKTPKTSILELSDFFTKSSDLTDVVTVALTSDPLYPIALTLGWFTLLNCDTTSAYSWRHSYTTTHPHLSPKLKKEWSYTANPPLGLHDLF